MIPAELFSTSGGLAKALTYRNGKGKKPGFVYILEDEGGAMFKIGFAVNPLSRLRQINSVGNMQDLFNDGRKARIVMAFEATLADESWMHLRFSRERVPWSTEWYWQGGELSYWVALLAKTGGTPK
jgi:hypothetical protein